MIEKLHNGFNGVDGLKILYVIFTFISILSIPVLLAFELEGLILLPYVFILLIIVSFYFSKYYIQIFVVFLFIHFLFTWKLRLVPVSLISYSIIFLYILNFRSKIFNDFFLPRSVKIASLIVLISVFLSSVITPFFSWLSIYYAFFFLLLMFFSYTIFRSIKNVEQIENIFVVFTISIFIASIIIILQIIGTQNIRSLGITSFPIMDFSAISLIIIFFYFYLFGNNKKIIKIATPFIFLILITTQSRFAWLGFLLSLIYGLIISVLYKKDLSKVIFKKVPIVIIITLVLLSVLYVLGLDRVILSRITNIDFNFFQGNEKGAVISNSLETRLLIWVVALNTFVHNPVFGVGYLMFSEISDAYNVVPVQLFEDFVKGLDAHTTFLNILCETGIVGLVSFLVYFITIFSISFKSIKLSKDTGNRDISIILNILIFFVLVHSIYSGAFTYGANAYYMHFLFGVTISNYFIRKNKISDKDLQIKINRQ